MLGKLFSRNRNIVDSDQECWISQQYQWLEQVIGFDVKPVPLVLPEEEIWNNPPNRRHDRAEWALERVKALMGLIEWPCRLEQQQQDTNPWVGEGALVENISWQDNPLGTFRLEGEDEAREAVITYHPDQVLNVEGLIATMAHELSHYILLCSERDDFPEFGTMSDEEQEAWWSEEECLTDLMAVASGFGIFLANSRQNFVQHHQGWSMSTAGYLSEAELVFALAVFLRRNNYDLVVAKPYLKPHLWKLLQQADIQYQARRG